MNRKIILAFSVLLLAVIATLLLSSPAEAEPSIKWNPKKVEQTLQPGQSRVIETSFTALADVPSAVLRVATSIAPYVTVQPTTIEAVSKGQTVSITLNLSVPIDALPATTSGAVQLRVAESHGKKDFGKTIARPLPVDVCVEWPTFDGGASLGITIDHPPTWHVTESSNAVSFSNVEQHGDLSDASLQTESFFRVRLGVSDNPLQLPPDEWFDRFMRPVVSENLLTEEVRAVAGRTALYVELSEIEGRRAHFYLINGANVTEVSYGLFAPSFVPLYEAMLQSLSFPL